MLEIKRGLLLSFTPSTYMASVLLFESPSCTLSNVPVAHHLDGGSCLPGALCALLFFDSQNPQDAVVIATFTNSGSGTLPAPPPGRLTFVPGFRQINSVAIPTGSTSSFTLAGSGGIPPNATAVLYKAFFTGSTSGSYVTLAPHGASDINAYATIGNLPAAGAFLNGAGWLQLDANGQIDIRANAGPCTVTLYTHGYCY